jgi:hypothetical protein
MNEFRKMPIFPYYWVERVRQIVTVNVRKIFFRIHHFRIDASFKFIHTADFVYCWFWETFVSIEFAKIPLENYPDAAFRRDFCRQYLDARQKETSEESLNRFEKQVDVGKLVSY